MKQLIIMLVLCMLVVSCANPLESEEIQKPILGNSIGNFLIFYDAKINTIRGFTEIFLEKNYCLSHIDIVDTDSAVFITPYFLKCSEKTDELYLVGLNEYIGYSTFPLYMYVITKTDTVFGIYYDEANP